MRWYRLSADHGYASAQNNLAVCYFYGRGVTQDKQEAMKWYRKAAGQGNVAAQYALRRLEGGPLSAPATEPPAENPLTVDEIKELGGSGVKAEVIIAEITKSHSRFSPQDITAAQQAGLDPDVIKCMQGSLR